MDGLTAPAPFLPPEAPLAMPVASLKDAPRAPGRLAGHGRAMGLRRAFVIGGAALLTAGGAEEMYRVLAVARLTAMEAVILALYVALFAWIAFSFMSAIAGFVSTLAGGGLGLGIDPSAPLPTLTTRTAILLPTYNEPPARVMAGLRATLQSLAATGQGAAFDAFILSDTTDPSVWIEEEAAFLALRAQGVATGGLHYRRRRHNTERKSGNIADWVMGFGASYPAMLILDADSLMEGDTLVRLAGAMETHPKVGLIQTLPVIIGGRTLFARMQQFAGRLYGPLIARGIAWWHGGEGNYWGHNAIIRTEAFAACAGLPHLRGRKPFGGPILSHDFVEAALLRRGGWAVHMVPALGGSFEEGPPSLTDLAIRDRRWCQGNLQHIGVLPGRGLHWVSRLHLLTGIGSYITAPLWLAFLLLGMLISLQARFIRPDYFPAGYSLFPDWPVIDPVRAASVFAGTMGLLLAPKLFAWIALLANGAERRRFGGASRAGASLLVETLIGGLLAPVAMILQSRAVASILAGQDSGWAAQKRDDGRIDWRDYASAYGGITLLGLAMSVAALAISRGLFYWMLPVLIGLVLAVPLAALTASAALGRAFARVGLLRTPEELSPPALVSSARAGAAAEREADWRRLLDDPALLAAHRAMLPPARRPGIDPLDVKLLTGRAKLAEAAEFDAGVRGLDRAELAAVLADREGLSMLEALASRG